MPQKLIRVATRFVAEQDGPSERDIKAALVQAFREEPVVQRAYLALAEHANEAGAHVTLAIRSSCGENKLLLRKLMSIFSAMFNSREHLDMMFLTDDQEHQLREVCEPFYRLDG